MAQQKPKATKPPKRALGRGFDALLPQNFNKDALLTPEDRIEKLTVGKLQANPFQPRTHFDESALLELAESIKRYGVVQPLVVTPAKDGMYTLIAGERRWRASLLAKLKTVPAIIRSTQELEQLEVALVENVQRVDLNALEQAISIERLHQQFSLSYEVIAQRLAKAPSTVYNMVRLLQLPEAARHALTTGQISEGHGRTILSLKADPSQQAELLQHITTQGWSVRQAERFVTSLKKAATNTQEARSRAAHTETPATKSLSKKLATPVTIRRTAKGGKLEIGFSSDDELARILQRIV